jgi:hypothetical protein
MPERERDPWIDRKRTRYDFDEAYVQSCLETIAYDSQMLADAEERARKAQRRLAGDAGGYDAARDDNGLPALNATMKGWLDEAGQ